MQSFTIQSTDGVQVQAYCWLPDNQPVAVLQVAHGMQEHARRYDHFAKWLNERSIAVFANDHIGHGLSAKTEAELSHFPRKDDWQRSVDILHILTLKIKSDYPGLPVILLGHSMGSVLLQTYMMRFGIEAEGYILSGAIRQPMFMATLGNVLASLLSILNGPADRSKLLISLGYGQYNQRFKPNRTGADWLCSENRVVDEYIASPLCGKRLTNRFYQNLTHGFKFIAKSGNLAKIPPEKGVLVIAGEDDPAGYFGKSPEKIKKLLEKHAKAKVSLKLYPGLRHEILNEKNREEIYYDMLRWIIKNQTQHD